MCRYGYPRSIYPRYGDIRQFAQSIMSSTQIVRRKGYLHQKETGIRSFLWTKKFVQLRDQMLTLHKNEARGKANFIDNISSLRYYTFKRN